MKKINLLATAALAAMMTLTSCDEDNGNVWSDEDVATRSLYGVTDEYSMLDNGLFNLAYPKDWSCVYSHVKGGIDETRLVGPDISVDVFIMPFNMAIDKMMDFLAKEELPEDVHLIKTLTGPFPHPVCSGSSRLSLTDDTGFPAKGDAIGHDSPVSQLLQGHKVFFLFNLCCRFLCI
jgi:hypothetical protein